MGIKTGCPVEWQRILGSEKPPHHMGIKTFLSWGFTRLNCPLKNLPTTWGLRPSAFVLSFRFVSL